MNIFINYRRSDSQYQVDRLFEELSVYLEAPEEQLYMDIEATPLGVDYIDYIQKKIRESDVFLAVIGDEWLLTQDAKSGEPRLNNPEDLVRREIAFSVEVEIPVIPTLLDEAVFPRPSQLPEEIGALTRRNGVAIRRRTFDEDVHALAEGLGLTGENRKKGVFLLPPLLGGSMLPGQTGNNNASQSPNPRPQNMARAMTTAKAAKGAVGASKIGMLLKLLIGAVVISVGGFLALTAITNGNRDGGKEPRPPIKTHSLNLSVSPKNLKSAKVGDSVKFSVTVTNTGNAAETNVRYGFKNVMTGKSNTVAKGTLAPGARFTERGVYQVRASDVSRGKIKFSFSTSSDAIRTPVTASLTVAKINAMPAKWSPWFDRDNPSGDGDFETIADLTKQFSGCVKPVAIECRVKSTKAKWQTARQVYNCDLQVGGSCRNSKQPNYSARNRTICTDYEARISCPIK